MREKKETFMKEEPEAMTLGGMRRSTSKVGYPVFTDIVVK